MIQAGSRHDVGPSLQTLGDYSKYVDKRMLEANDGWRKAQITVTSADVPELGTRTMSYPFYHVDMNVVLKELFGRVNYKDHFAAALEFKMKKDAAGVR